MNHFKIWLNKNSLKMFVIILLIIIGYNMIKGLDDYYEKKKEDRKEQILYEQSNFSAQENENIELNEALKDSNQTELNSIKFPKIDKQSNEYQNLVLVLKKLLNAVYEANLNTDSIISKSDVYNMFSDELIEYFTTGEKAVSVDNILDYIFKVENIDDFSIGNIYKYSNYNNVIRYEIMLRYKSNAQEPVDGYLIINMDYNNHTFSYDGFWSKIDDIDGDKIIKFIDNKGSNTF